MTIANGMQSVLSERHQKLFLIYELYRVDTEIADVHADIESIFLKSNRPLLP